MADSIGKAMMDMVKRAGDAYPEDTHDYKDENGVIICGFCHTPRETLQEFNFGGVKRIIHCPVLCKCRRAKDDLKRQQIADMQAAAALQELRSQSLMDDRLANATFSTFRITENNEKPFRYCKRYVERFDEMKSTNQGLLLHGPVGTGKSFAAACIANELLSKGVSVVMTSFVKLIERFSGFDDDTQYLIDLLNKASLLIIDDLGAERATDFSLEKVYNVIDSRYRAKLPMILTTNVTLPEMKNTTDIRYQRIYDRVFENCFPIQFSGPSWRRKEASSRFNTMKKMLEE